LFESVDVTVTVELPLAVGVPESTLPDYVRPPGRPDAA
jgi:hypothetical protein